jgi:hypothetical protein
MSILSQLRGEDQRIRTLVDSRNAWHMRLGRDQLADGRRRLWLSRPHARVSAPGKIVRRRGWFMTTFT